VEDGVQREIKCGNLVEIRTEIWLSPAYARSSSCFKNLNFFPKESGKLPLNFKWCKRVENC
jgi:hypothetical protein